MSLPYYNINGINILPYVDEDGIKWSSNDIDAPSTGRTMDGVMHRAVVDDKDKHEFKLRPLTPEESSPILSAIRNNKFVTVSTNIHPVFETVTMEMYNSTRNAAVAAIYDDGTVLWKDISFNLIEQ